MRMKKKILFGAAAVALVGAITATLLLTGFTGGTDEAEATQVRTAALEKTDLAVSVSATGTVYSESATGVYSNSSYPVKSVAVSVGDTVRAGDVLAELDLADMEEDVAQKRAALSASQASASHSLAAAQNDLATYYRNVQEGNDTELLNARAAVASAELELENARLDVQSAEIEVESASDEYYDARQEVEEAEDEGDEDAELDQYEDARDSARTALQKARTSLEKAQSNYTKAEQNLEKAKATLAATVVSVENQYADYQEKVQSAALNTDFTEQKLALSQMEAELANAAILSPVSGTVTEVYAEAGASGSGLLFVIQDTGRLKVIANIKEYDIGAVMPGNRVIIETDATGGAEIGGTLRKIAPTSTLTAAGDMSESSTEAEYQSEIAVAASGSREGLKIGMNAQLSIITEERTGVFAVLYDAVVKTPERTIIYTLAPAAGAPGQESPGFTAKAVEVTAGLEKDLSIEVRGEGLAEGMAVISDATGIAEGMAVAPRGAGAAGLPAGGQAPQNAGGGIPLPGMGGPPGGMGGGPR
jgi:multidrug efflux pump subunit AcrA (membrane-fusion protein)